MRLDDEGVPVRSRVPGGGTGLVVGVEAVEVQLQVEVEVEVAELVSP